MAGKKILRAGCEGSGDPVVHDVPIADRGGVELDKNRSCRAGREWRTEPSKPDLGEAQA